MITLLLGAALVVIAALLVASSKIIDERDQWIAYAWSLQEALDEKTGVDR